VRRPNRHGEEYAAVLRRTELALSIAPERYAERGLLLLAHGSALFRAKSYGEVEKVLSKAERELRQGPFQRWLPAATAVRAMALYELGKRDAAREAFRRAGNITGGPDQYPNDEVVGVFHEAEALIAE